MFRNYLTIALRHLRKQKGYAFINMAGLSVGIACCLLMVLFVQDERSYDSFHEKADQIYRIAYTATFSGNAAAAALGPSAMAPTLVQDYPDVLAATRIFAYPLPRTVRYEDRSFSQTGLYYVDSTLFDLFSFSLRRGNPKTVFDAPYTVVLTESTARKYFGDDDPMNKTLLFGDSTAYTITGIIADAPPNSHFQFDMLASISTLWGRGVFRDNDWFNDIYYTYFILQPGADPDALEAKLIDFVARHASAAMKQNFGFTFEEYVAQSRFTYFLQPLRAIHLHSQFEKELSPNGNIVYVYLFAAVALFILLMACINFMNLATARSAGRALEVGVRKALGAERPDLIRQFLGESMVLSVLAMGLAVALAAASLPLFNDLAGKELTLAALGRSSVLAAIGALTLGVGLLAGSYPAFFLSAFRPVVVLKKTVQAGMKRSTLRGGLVVFQFAVSITLIIGTVVVFNQLHYVRTKPLGFVREHVVVIQRANELGAQNETFQQTLRADPRILAVAGTTALPGSNTYDHATIQAEGHDAATENLQPAIFYANHDLAEVLKLEVVAGRTFSRDFPTDTAAVVINEAAARLFNWPDPLGKQLTIPWLRLQDQRPFQIIGVVADYHATSLHEAITPLVMHLYPGRLQNLAVRVQPGDLPGTLAFIEAQWKTFQPGKPFTYSFLDDTLEAQYQAEQQLGKVFTVFALFALVIAGLGLFGLASFAAEQRRKEIGVRKVMGATVPQIVLLLTKEFTLLVGIAFVVAAPLAYFAMRRWLEAFAYRIDLSWPIFLMAGLTALAVAWLTVSYQSIRAALADPVKSLRYE